MTDVFDPSVTLGIRGLVQGDDEAAARLRARCSDQLVRVASRKPGHAARRIADEEADLHSLSRQDCRCFRVVTAVGDDP